MVKIPYFSENDKSVIFEKSEKKGPKKWYEVLGPFFEGYFLASFELRRIWSSFLSINLENGKKEPKLVFLKPLKNPILRYLVGKRPFSGFFGFMCTGFFGIFDLHFLNIFLFLR